MRPSPLDAISSKNVHRPSKIRSFAAASETMGHLASLRRHLITHQVHGSELLRESIKNGHSLEFLPVNCVFPEESGDGETEMET